MTDSASQSELWFLFVLHNLAPSYIVMLFAEGQGSLYLKQLHEENQSIEFHCHFQIWTAYR